MKINGKSYLFFLPLLMIIFSISTACSSTSPKEEIPSLDLAPLDHMPAYVRDAPHTVKQAYQFAVANPDVLTELPCYCGCGPMGHTSNYKCYVAGTGENGEVIYDSHAIGCSICVDITLDAMRLMREGKSTEWIRDYVDATYSKYGPSNIP